MDTGCTTSWGQFTFSRGRRPLLLYGYREKIFKALSVALIMRGPSLNPSRQQSGDRGRRWAALLKIDASLVAPCPAARPDNIR